ncbi:hypothetical protein FKV70_10160 [Paenibacillus ottowii]|uniref:Uncharacterized protein n=1 Tax=Paenibacillus ottowii TaxID=2315729 RepID=A0ABY3B5D6_9BACL|nr:hypothetical protein FKV70_10160 [Paenibacillus ottowii]
MCFGIATSLLLSLSSAAFAQDSISSNRTDIGYVKVIENTENQDGHVIIPFDVQLINPIHHTGKGALEKTFTMDPRNGQDANVFIKNNGSSTVYIEFGIDGKDPLELSLEPGKQKNIQVYTKKTNSYKLYIYNKDGSSMDLQVSARQF